MKRIVLTGGGTAGHVTPNMALIPSLQKNDFDIHYIGSHDGIERKLIEDMKIPYHGISVGKLRRYLDVKNLTDPFKVVKGIHEASSLLKALKPDIIFSKGGFVSVPVVLAAKRRKIPVIIHESDMTPGLANKIAIPCATKVCCNFPETMKHLPEGKAVLTGSPIRMELFQGNPNDAKKLCGFEDDKPSLLVIGGSQGSVIINNTVRSCLNDLLSDFNIIHICGKDKIDESLRGTKGYVQFDYVKKELSSLLALADIVISRAGANAICELLALHKPNILIPLSANASRGDQILNSRSFESSGYSFVIEEENLSNKTLTDAVNSVYKKRYQYIDAMESGHSANPIDTIMNLIIENCK